MEQTPFPETLAGHEVVDTARVPSRPGEVPELAILMGRDPNRPEDRAYVVWDAAVRGGQWAGYSSDHSLSRAAAEEEFDRRVTHRRRYNGDS